MASLNTLTRTHYYGPTRLLGLWFVRVNMDGPIAKRTAVTDDFGNLAYVDLKQTSWSGV